LHSYFDFCDGITNNLKYGSDETLESRGKSCQKPVKIIEMALTMRILVQSINYRGKYGQAAHLNQAECMKIHRRKLPFIPCVTGSTGLGGSSFFFADAAAADSAFLASSGAMPVEQ
jgi:hypothetical protein